MRKNKQQNKATRQQTSQENNFSKGSGRGRRRGRPKEVEVNVDREDVNKADFRGDNDPSWYTHYPTLAKNVTGVNFGEILGGELRWNLPTSTSVTLFNKTVAGIAALHYVPTLGDTTKYRSNTANKVATQLFNVMRQELGSRADYEACDTSLYLGAMDSAYQLYAIGVRAYGIMRMASPFNLYFLQNLCKACNIDYQSFAANISNFRATLNQYAIQLSSLMVPDFDIFKRHIWMITNLFTDSNTAKAQLYTMVPDGYYVYTEQTEGPAYLNWQPLPGSDIVGDVLTYSQWSTMINNVITGLVGSTDVQQMSADMGKAFKDQCVVLTLIPEDYVTPVSFSKEVLSQFENAVLLGQVATANLPSGTKNLNITQSLSFTGQTNPNLQQEAYFNPVTRGTAIATSNKACAEMYNANKMLNFHDMEIPNEMILVATRGIPGEIETYFDSTTGISHVVVKPINYGTELYTRCALYYTTTAPNTMSYYSYSYVTGVPKASDNSSEIYASLISQFDWAPQMWLWTMDDNNMYRIQDIDMYGFVDSAQASALNVNAVLSEFYSDKFPNLLR